MIAGPPTRLKSDPDGDLVAIPNHLHVSTNVDTDQCTVNIGHRADSEITMRVLVKKWGNSASVRIPSQVMAAAALSVDQAVDIRAESGRIVIEPIADPVYDLDELLDRMTPDTFHDDVDFGPPVGKEIW